MINKKNAIFKITKNNTRFVILTMKVIRKEINIKILMKDSTI